MPEIHIIRRIYTDPASIAVFVALLLAGEREIPLCLLVASLLHEAGHLFFLWRWNIPILRCRIGISGADIVTGGLLSYRRENLMLFAGSGCNLLLVLCLIPFLNAGSAYLVLLCVSALCGLFNLLPFRGLDGGRILENLIAMRFGTYIAARVLRVSSVLCIIFCWCLGATIFLRSSYQIPGKFSLGSSLFFVSLFFLFQLTKKENSFEK